MGNFDFSKSGSWENGNQEWETLLHGFFIAHVRSWSILRHKLNSRSFNRFWVSEIQFARITKTNGATLPSPLLSYFLGAYCHSNGDWESTLSSSIPTPAGYIALTTYQYLKSLPNTNIQVQITGWSDNPWYDFSENGSITSMSIVLAVLVLICLFWASHKLFKFYKHGQFQINIATVCLGFEICNSLVRLTYLLMNAAFPYIPVLSYNYQNISLLLSMLAFPFTFSSATFMIFFLVGYYYFQ